MATEKQFAANRANSLKSSGPTTEAGKTRSSLNALKHGCTSQTMIFPGEDSTHFHNFHQSYIKDFLPQGALEYSLVQELAQTQWAMNRIRAHETTLFALGHEKNAEGFKTCGDQTIQAAFAGAATFKAESDALKNVGLYLQRNSRMFLNTLKTLREIQAARIASHQVVLQEAAHMAVLHERLKLPFVPATLGFVCSDEEIAPLLRRERFRETVAAARKHPNPPEIQVTNAP